MNDQRDALRAFGARYDYDPGYLIEILEASPGAFAAFAPAQAMSRYREALPVDAHFVARVAAMRTEDCGPCTQLNLRMAAEAGVDRDLLRTLVDDPPGLPEPLADVHAFATAVAAGEPADTERMRECYGDAGLAELAVCIAGARIYPALKRAMGRGVACAPLHLEIR